MDISDKLVHELTKDIKTQDDINAPRTILVGDGREHLNKFEIIADHVSKYQPDTLERLTATGAISQITQEIIASLSLERSPVTQDADRSEYNSSQASGKDDAEPDYEESSEETLKSREEKHPDSCQCVSPN